MKRLLNVFILLVSLIISATAFASPSEGKQYTLLEKPYSTEYQVEKFFSLTCMPCWQMTELLKDKEGSGELKLHRTHVIFNDSTLQAAGIYYTVLAQKPDLSHELLSELFSLVQTKNPLQETDIDAFFKEHNLLKQKDMTQDQQQQWAKFMEDAITKTEQASISSIPSFIINGHYMVKLRGHRSMEELLETIQYLSEQ
ncbi:Peptide permease [Vibrio chagasii]|uniref:thioredoxin domain-containing protein n=1 Tax=Vibrio chagasii TaxID=170679 RepID=UPI001EFDA81D|nr:thioredoxin domain-containing protein [Vibrio chagasii]MDE9382438.1 thioredoxin domain-containing protein [Vibrio alginolyticus]MCG9603594.1 thioredoxin domain-containing protein [Vibrio chagasii]CAH7068798.1 Peptide permease [Vibrio chagasii]CAH7109519.1 Peptide permease [Vibrio chagasii]CAH7232246.1 Peptide permease [Vibrio chagasii]